MPTKRVVFKFDDRDKLSIEELEKRGAVLPCVLEQPMTQDERIEKLEREVAELRDMFTVLMGRAETLQLLGGGMSPPPLTTGPIFKRPIPPMCDEGGWNHVPGTCGPIMPIHYPEEPPSWDITTMLEEGRKQMLTPEGERLVREAKQQDLPQCHL